MSPKKSPKVSRMVGAYDIDAMNDQELKDYINALKDEIERIKSNLYHHQRSKGGLGGFLKIAEAEVLNKEEELIEKHVETQKHFQALHFYLKEKEKEILIEELEIKQKDLKNTSESFKKLQDVKVKHEEENKYVRNSLELSEREIAQKLFDLEFVDIDTIEKMEQNWQSCSIGTQDRISSVVEEHVSKYSDATKNFYSEKIKKMAAIWEPILERKELEYSISNHAEEMSIYFIDILWKNLKVTSQLRNKVNQLESELNKLRLKIKKAKSECKNLRSKTYKENTEENDTNISAVSKFTKCLGQLNINDLFYENDVLNQKLRCLKKEREALMKRFMTAVRRINENAEFRSFILEKSLTSFKNQKINNRTSSMPQYAILLKKQINGFE